MDKLKLSSIRNQVDDQNKEILSVKRPVKSFKRQHKQLYSLKTDIRRRNTAINAGYKSKLIHEASLYHANSVANVNKHKPSIKKVVTTNIHTVNTAIKKPKTRSVIGNKPVNWENDHQAKI